MPFLTPWKMTGSPAACVPLRRDQLPIGLLVVGPHAADDAALAAAAPTRTPSARCRVLGIDTDGDGRV
jgi:Asp-tRNA(Asn)/Glu-tRNA(Gln) amidotransferase A subunit family amidase